jgi:tetratricopeptide (TPR) repeat protein
MRSGGRWGVGRLQRPAIVVAALAMAQVVQAEPAPAAGHRLQDDFNAATTAAQAGHCADAEPIFARLAVDPRIKPGSLPAATIALRRGQCHVATGDDQQGAAWIRQGLPVVEVGGPDLIDEASLGWLTLAHLAMRDYDHDSAVEAYRHVLGMPGQADRIDALTGLAIATMFDGDGTALSLADRSLAIVAASPAGKDRSKSEAQVRTLRARALMAVGRNDEASKEAEKALSLSGGLGLKVSLVDVGLRADAAEAALLINHTQRARELLAYTGAGRIAQSPFAAATSMEVPDCDNAAGLGPDDFAVVEFSIRPDGRLGEAQTTFTRGNYAVARAFAQAVRGWVWQPEAVAKLPPFYRALVRVELRCSNNAGGLPTVTAVFNQRLAYWAQAGIAQVTPPSSGESNVAWLRRSAAALEMAGNRTAAGTLLMLALAQDPVVRATDLADTDRAQALLADADPARRASAALMHAVATMRAMQLKTLVTGKSENGGEEVLLDATAQPVIAADALAQDTLRLRAVTTHLIGYFNDREIATLKAVADDDRLGATSPLRQVAQLRLASIAARAGRRAEAEALFARTGLSEEQCSLVGDIPRMKSMDFDKEFPTDAMAMGFEGWVREEFDIAADGHTVAPRALIAYPPFVFVEGARNLIKDARFDISFRPAGKLACSARAETIRFNLPDKH